MKSDEDSTEPIDSQLYRIISYQKNREKDKKYKHAMNMKGVSNLAYDTSGEKDLSTNNNHPPNANKQDEVESAPQRETWGNGLEFLMSCIAMSVGLGNIWRFPFTAYENGGGAFLIPYIIVLLLVGKPMYYIEMIIGQFSSKGTVRVFDYAPALRGTGIGQTVAVMFVMTYYSSIMALIFYYFIISFFPELPWSVCDPSWTDCYPSGDIDADPNSTVGLTSSTELYFIRKVLREPENINDGIGYPSWQLSLCLFAAWVSIFIVLRRGVQSSGKISYFLALFPYVIIIVLLIRASTLPGAAEGIIFFLKPDFKKILEPDVWYAAVTQCFFSLAVGFGNVVMYSSYNKFTQNIYRDALVVTSLDTVTSILAGLTIFGILGNLAHESGSDVENVVNGGPMLAFVSYPEAITKFRSVPQLFSVLFFLMLFVLGIGSNVAMASVVVTAVRDKYPNIQYWKAIAVLCVVGFLVSLVYVTPGGQFILTLVDHHGGSFIVFILAIVQCVGVFWIYGVVNSADDVRFMLNRGVSWYFRICWTLVTPIFLIIIFIYTLVKMKPIQYNGVDYPTSAYVVGWLISAAGVVPVAFMLIRAYWRRRKLGDFKTITKDAFSPKEEWGPVDKKIKAEWIAFKEQRIMERIENRRGKGKCRVFIENFFGY